MDALRIRLKKGRDGPHSLVCIRPDGSHTRQHDRTGGFFPVHDLTHYAVETGLGYRRGFFGIVADGWDLTDFGAPWPKGPFPADADPAEVVVGLLDAERAGGRIMAAAELSWGGNQVVGPAGSPVSISEEQLGLVRARRAELVAAWKALEPGETMDLSFPL